MGGRFYDWLLSAGGITGKTVDDTAGVSLGAGRITNTQFGGDEAKDCQQ